MAAALLSLVVATATSPRLTAAEPLGWRPAPADTLRTIMLPPARPGAVLTAVVEVPLGVRGHGSARYRIVPGSRVRLFGTPAGTYAPNQVPARIPLTFTLPRDQEAGPLLIATVRLTWEDGTSYTAELRLEVITQRRLKLSLVSAATASSGRPLVIHYRLQNLGNAGDTVDFHIGVSGGWTAPPDPPAVYLARDDTTTGSFVVRVPKNTLPARYVVSLTAVGRGDTAVANAFVRSAGDDGASAWATIPGVLFVGAPDLGGGRQDPEISFRASGHVDSRTSVDLGFHHAGSGDRPIAFARFQGTQDYFATVERSGFRATAGNVNALLPGPVGGYQTGTGGLLTWNRGTSGELFFARPRDYGAQSMDGHLAQASFGIPTARGDFSARLMDLERPIAPGEGDYRTQAASFAYDFAGSGRQRISLEGGYARVEQDSAGSAAGPVIEAQYAFTSKSSYLTARFRHVPAAVPISVQPDETYVAGALGLARGFHLVGWHAATSLPLLGAPANARQDDALGVRFSAGASSVQLRADAEHTTAPLLQGGDWRQYGAVLSANVPLRSFTLSGEGEIGAVLTGQTTRPARSLNARAGWGAKSAAAWLGLSYSEGYFGRMPLRADIGTSALIRGVAIDAGAGGTLPYLGSAYLDQFWTSATIPLPLGSGLVAGVQYQPWQHPGQRLRFAAGVQMGLPAPMPLIGGRGARGSVFEDLNANGRRDRGEPLLPGVGVERGPLNTTTDARGRFRFPHQGGAREDVQVDMASMPLGWLAEPYESHGRKIEVPVVRAGALRIHLVAAGAAGADSSRTPVPGIWIDLTDAEARQRSEASDSAGIISFAALPPGTYTLTVHPVGGRGQALPPKVLSVKVPYGGTGNIVVAVPTPKLEVRFTTPPPPASPADSSLSHGPQIEHESTRADSALRPVAHHQLGVAAGAAGSDRLPRREQDQTRPDSTRRAGTDGHTHQNSGRPAVTLNRKQHPVAVRPHPHPNLAARSGSTSAAGARPRDRHGVQLRHGRNTDTEPHPGPRPQRRTVGGERPGLGLVLVLAVMILPVLVLGRRLLRRKNGQ